MLQSVIARFQVVIDRHFVQGFSCMFVTTSVYACLGEQNHHCCCISVCFTRVLKPRLLTNHHTDLKQQATHLAQLAHSFLFIRKVQKLALTCRSFLGLVIQSMIQSVIPRQHAKHGVCPHILFALYLVNGSGNVAGSANMGVLGSCD